MEGAQPWAPSALQAQRPPSPRRSAASAAACPVATGAPRGIAVPLSEVPFRCGAAIPRGAPKPLVSPRPAALGRGAPPPLRCIRADTAGWRRVHWCNLAAGLSTAAGRRECVEALEMQKLADAALAPLPGTVRAKRVWPTYERSDHRSSCKSPDWRPVGLLPFTRLARRLALQVVVHWPMHQIVALWRASGPASRKRMDRARRAPERVFPQEAE